ncbi:hypothetical protein Bca101_037909 [Brassica carinata]
MLTSVIWASRFTGPLMFDEDRSEGLNDSEISRHYYKPHSARCRRDIDLVRKTKPEQLRRGGENPETKPMRKTEERKKKPAADSSAAAAAESPVGLRAVSGAEETAPSRRGGLEELPIGSRREEAVASEEADLERRSETTNPNNGIGASVNSSNNNNIPAKFVSVPATDKEKRSSNSNADASIKRVVVKRNVASPRSQSPARAASPRAQSPARVINHS